MRRILLFHPLFLPGAVETCLHTGSAEEVIECVNNILDNIGQGDCRAFICHIIPQFSQEKKMVAAEEKSHWKEMVQPAKAKSQKRSDSEAEKDPQLSCNFLTCAGSILSEIGFEIDCPSFLFL